MYECTIQASLLRLIAAIKITVTTSYSDCESSSSSLPPSLPPSLLPSLFQIQNDTLSSRLRDEVANQHEIQRK